MMVDDGSTLTPVVRAVPSVMATVDVNASRPHVEFNRLGRDRSCHGKQGGCPQQHCHFGSHAGSPSTRLVCWFPQHDDRGWQDNEEGSDAVPKVREGGFSRWAACAAPY